MGEGDRRHAPTASPPGKETRYPLYKRLGGTQGRSGRVRKISPPAVFDPWTVQPLDSRYADYATAAHRHVTVQTTVFKLRAYRPNKSITLIHFFVDFPAVHSDACARVYNVCV